QGIEAQTLANVYLALDNDLEILPVINKIDLPAANPERVQQEIEDVIGLDASEAVFARDRKSTRLNSSHVSISYAVFGLKKKRGSGLDPLLARLVVAGATRDEALGGARRALEAGSTEGRSTVLPLHGVLGAQTAAAPVLA